MKLQQLEYVVAIAREGSITGAAKKLYQSQPNVSTALKELEAETGVQIFWRTGSGMVLTPEGEEFFGKARKIISDFHDLADSYSKGKGSSISFRVSATHSSYITAAVGLWINQLSSSGKNYNMHFIETNTSRVIEDISSGRSDIGVIRTAVGQGELYEEKLQARGLVREILTEFPMRVMMRKDHPLSELDDIPFEMLRECTEVIHGDEDLDLFRKTYINPDYDTEYTGKAVFVYDRGSKISMLNTINDAYMWVSPMPESDLLHSNMVIKKCSYACVRICDMILYSPASKLIGLINSCISSLMDYSAENFGDNWKN